MTQKNDRSVEEILGRLREITELLEKGEISLDESLKLYEEGVSLTIECKKLLDSAQLKIKELSADVTEAEADDGSV